MSGLPLAGRPQRRPEAQAAHGLHLFLADIDDFDDQSVSRLASLLDGKETARAARFQRRVDRRRYAAAHGLLRSCLSRFANRPPEAWEFTWGLHGRPEVANPEANGLRFSLSHCDDAVAILVHDRRDAGVDIERLNPDVDMEAVAAYAFSQDERRQLEGGSDGMRLRRFYAFWTLKEAYSKALGIGMGRPFDCFSFHLTPAGEWAVRDDDAARPHDDGTAWRFLLLRPDPAHVLAIAAAGRTPLPGELATVRLSPAHVIGALDRTPPGRLAV